jgi:hypothetical protein
MRILNEDEIALIFLFAWASRFGGRKPWVASREQTAGIDYESKNVEFGAQAAATSRRLFKAFPELGFGDKEKLDGTATIEPVTLTPPNTSAMIRNQRLLLLLTLKG